MAIVSKTTRCAVCGSTDVTFSEATKRYHCASCGADEAHAMNAADVAAINSIAALVASDPVKADKLPISGYETAAEGGFVVRAGDARYACSTAERRGLTEQTLTAQVHATAFYERLGFKVVSDEFLEAGIPHVEMLRRSQ